MTSTPLNRLYENLADGGEAEPDSAAENRLFDASWELLDSARALEDAATARGGGAALPPTLGSLGAAFDALASAVLALRKRASELGGEEAGEESAEQLEQLRRLLFAVDQNLRFAAEATERARASAAELTRRREQR